MLPLDALLKRASLATLAGILASTVLDAKWSVFVGVIALYVLLIVYTKPETKWPPGQD